MSLFPAYSSAQTTANDDIPLPDSVPATAPKSSWLVNPSFENAAHLQSSTADETVIPQPQSPIEIVDSDQSHETKQRAHKTKRPSNPDSDNASSASSTSRRHQRHKSSSSSKKKKRRRERDQTPAAAEPPNIEFTGREEYYVDKKWERGYLSVQSLHRPACPKYRMYSRPLAPLPRSAAAGRQLLQRYYTKSKLNRTVASGAPDASTNTEHRLSEDEFIRCNRDFNQRLSHAPDDIAEWLRFVRHQEQSPQRLTKLQLAERKMDLLNRAIHENMSATSDDRRDRLYAEYATVIEHTYPSFEVSKLLDALLARDATNYTLWNAQILATQGSMARCIVPDVLKLYEQCMKHMYKRNRYDAIMLSMN